MPFKLTPQPFKAAIKEVEVGSGEKAIKLGGEKTFPFYTFDAPMPNAPKIGVEISDLGFEGRCLWGRRWPWWAPRETSPGPICIWS